MRDSRVRGLTITHSRAGVVPEVFVQTSLASKFADYMNQGAETIKVWCPKLTRLFVDYDPPSKIYTIVRNKPCYAPAWANNEGGVNIIYICNDQAQYDIDHPGPGPFAHESTHISQVYPGYWSTAVMEGVASLINSKSVNHHPPRPEKWNAALEGYDVAFYFYDWISLKYNEPNLIADLNHELHAGTYDESWFRAYTGKSIGQLWSEMVGAVVTSPSNLAHTRAHLCAWRNEDSQP